MNDYHVDYIEIERHATPFVNKGLFEFRKDKRNHLLQQLCFWILGKIGSHSIGEKISYSRHKIDTPNFMEKLHRQKRGLLDLYNTQGERLLIGNDEYMKLTSNPEVRKMIHFTGEYCGRHGEVLGMKITVIPWMSGMVVVPRDAS